MAHDYEAELRMSQADLQSYIDVWGMDVARYGDWVELAPPQATPPDPVCG